MISLIKFEKELIIPKKEAESLDLKYVETARIGIRDNEIKRLASYEYFKDECIEQDGKYYRNQADLAKGIIKEFYYLFDRYESENDYVCVEKEGHLVNFTIFAPKCKYPFSIIESVASQPILENIESIMQHLENKSTMLEQLVENVTRNTFNKKTNVHVGGGLITTYNDLMLKENVCTDVLQTELNNGWRIIAVCVQPDQRRPDYILGRYNPTLEVAAKQDAGR